MLLGPLDAPFNLGHPSLTNHCITILSRWMEKGHTDCQLGNPTFLEPWISNHCLGVAFLLADVELVLKRGSTRCLDVPCCLGMSRLMAGRTGRWGCRAVGAWEAYSLTMHIIMDASTILVSLEEILGPTDRYARVVVIPLEHVAAVAFSLQRHYMEQAQHGEAIRGMREHLLGYVPIQEELTVF
ncbi:hypothetical protein Tco_1228427 [Tanacetum coccineum]